MSKRKFMGYRLERWDGAAWEDVFVCGHLLKREELEREWRVYGEPGAKLRAVPVYEGEAIFSPIREAASG